MRKAFALKILSINDRRAKLLFKDHSVVPMRDHKALDVRFLLTISRVTSMPHETRKRFVPFTLSYREGRKEKFYQIFLFVFDSRESLMLVS